MMLEEWVFGLAVPFFLHCYRFSFSWTMSDSYKTEPHDNTALYLQTLKEDKSSFANSSLSRMML